MVKTLMVIGAVAGFAVAGAGMASMRSDIQFIVALIGFFSALILIGLATVLHRLR
ncbi:MAG: hypothetical protein ACK4M0_01710 [Phreatobacter sp.]